MSIEISRFPEIGTIVFVFKDPLDPLTDPPVSKQAVVEFQHEMNSSIVRIIDFNQCTLDFGLFVHGMGQDMNGAGGFKDPNIITYLVSTSPLAKMSVESIKQQDQYGKVAAVELFETRDAALERARQR